MSTCHIQLLYIVATNSCHTHSPLHCYLRPPYIVATYNRHKQLPYTHTITPLVLKLRYTGVIYSRHTQLPYYVTSHWYIHISCYNTFIIYNRHTKSVHTVVTHSASCGHNRCSPASDSDCELICWFWRISDFHLSRVLLYGLYQPLFDFQYLNIRSRQYLPSFWKVTLLPVLLFRLLPRRRTPQMRRNESYSAARGD